MSVEIVKIKELDLDMIHPTTKEFYDKKGFGGSKIAIVARPGLGKSTLISSIAYAKKHIFPAGLFMSGTEDTNHFYKSFAPSSFVFNGYDEDKLEQFIQRQKLAIEHLDNPWSLLVVDDCTDDSTVFRKPLQAGLLKKGRHWKMLYIIAMQYVFDMPTVIRSNLDGVFLFREPSLRCRKILYENYAGIIPDFKLFGEIMDQITDDHTALYINNVSSSNNWQDCVFWFKAVKPPEDFKFGCEDYWKFHYDRYNPEYVDVAN